LPLRDSPGSKIPPEMMAFNPSSTEISGWITSFLDVMIKTPEVGFGVVGTNT